MKRSLAIHIAWFAAAHAAAYVIIHSDMALPPWLLSFKEAAVSGKIGLYHEPAGIYINGLWLLILIIDACYSFSGSKPKEQAFTVPAQRSSGPPPARPPIEPLEPQASPVCGKPGPRSRPWFYLLLGGMLEIVWASLLKLNMLGGPLLVIFYFSFYCLAKAAKSLPVSTVAAAFAGIGAGGTVTMDMLLFDSGVNWVRLGLAALLVCFILLLKLGGEPKAKAGG